MKKYFYLIGLFASLLFYYNTISNTALPNEPIESKIENNLIRFKVVGNSMSPLLNQGDKILIKANEKPHKGNLVLIQGKLKKPAIIKRVVAEANDVIGLKQFCILGDFTLLVNDVPMTNSKRQPLCLSAKQAKKLKKFIDYSKGVIPEDYYFVLGDNNQSIDSRIFGLISSSSILGVRVGTNIK